MATGLKIIKKAFRLIQVKESSESISAAEGQDALDSLNGLIDALTNDPLMQHNRELIEAPFVNGQASYTFGPGGEINYPRSVSIENAFVRQGTTDWPIVEINNNQYAQIVQKTTGNSYPLYFYYRAKYPLGEISFWPVPQGNTTLFMNVRDSLPKYDNINQDINWPPGYERYLSYELAKEIAPEYRNDIPPLVMKIAGEAKADIQNVNDIDIPVLNSPLAYRYDDVGAWWGGGCSCPPEPPIDFDLIIETGNPSDLLYIQTGNPSDDLIAQPGI